MEWNYLLLCVKILIDFDVDFPVLLSSDKLCSNDLGCNGVGLR